MIPGGSELAASLTEDGDPRRVYDGRYIGIRLHRFIPVLYDLQPNLTVAAVLGAAASFENVRRATTYRQAAIQRLANAAWVYRRLFWPGPEWTLAGAEYPVGSVRLDLLWTSDGRYFADEVKTGQAAARLSAEAILRQTTQQLDAAVEHFGTAFVGVRTLLLAEPKRSYWRRPDGRVEPVVPSFTTT